MNFIGHYNLCRLDGYENALTFQEITDERIAQTESFVRNEMYNYLIRTTAESINANDESYLTDDDVLITKEQLIDHFGKIYASDPSNFRFQSGEIVLIKELVKHVKGKVGSEQKKGLKQFKPSQQKKSKSQPNSCTKLAEPTVEKLTSELMQRVIDCVSQYGAENFCVVDETVDVQIKKGVGISGLIRCEICMAEKKKKSKPKRVYYNDSSEWPCWILSNFTKHLKTVHKLKPCTSNSRKTKLSVVKFPDQNIENVNETQEQLNDSEVVVIEEEVVVEIAENDESEFVINGSAIPIQINITISVLNR